MQVKLTRTMLLIVALAVAITAVAAYGGYTYLTPKSIGQPKVLRYSDPTTNIHTLADKFPSTASYFQWVPTDHNNQLFSMQVQIEYAFNGSNRQGIFQILVNEEVVASKNVRGETSLVWQQASLTKSDLAIYNQTNYVFQVQVTMYWVPIITRNVNLQVTVTEG